MTDPVIRPKQPLFLERQSYRRRRLIDASRLIPVFGVFLFMVPLIWPGVGNGDTNLAARGIYVFAVWFLLVGVTAIVSHRLRGRAQRLPSVTPGISDHAGPASAADQTDTARTNEARDHVL